MSEELETEEQDEISDLDYVDTRMRSLGQCLNLLDPDGTFKGMPSEETLIKIMQAVREDYRNLSDAILALREEDIEPTSRHDGNLDEKGTYEMLYHIERPNGSLATCIALEDDCGNFRAHLTPKQALSLLAWLRQEEEALKRLAKDQVEW